MGNGAEWAPDLLTHAVSRLYLLGIMGKRIIVDPVTLCCIEADEISAKILSSAQAFLTKNPSATDSELRGHVLRWCTEPWLDEFLADLAALKEQGKILSEERRAAMPSADAPLTYAALNISHACNLKCRYCFADAGTYGDAPSFMSEEMAKQAIDFLLQRSHEDYIGLSFFGGEPLLNFDIVRSSVEYCKAEAAKMGKRCNFHVTTNGTLLTPDIIDFLAANDFTMIVSLDGPPEFHDSMRVYPGGGGTHDVVMRNLETMRGTPLSSRTTFTCTFTRDNPSVMERFTYLWELCKKGYAAEFSVEAADLPESHPLGFTPADLGALKRAQEQIASLYCERLNAGEHIRFFHSHQVMERLLKITEGGLGTCRTGKGYVTIGPDGSIFACQKEGRTKIGSLDDGFDPILRETWLQNNPFSKKPCPTCWARNACGGGCLFNAIHYRGDVATPDWFGCTLRRHWIALCIWILSELDEEGTALLVGLHRAGVTKRSGPEALSTEQGGRV
jgi:uncharacterized protein